jgi:lambda family phage minor tail protein L
VTDIIKTTQLQDPGSSLIVLYELEYADGAFAYFYAGKAEFDGTTLENVRFREWRSEYVIGAEIEYVGIPIEAEGFDISSDGAISRPTLTIANMGTILSDSVGGLRPEELVGAKLTRRVTLEKYLVGGASDVGPGLAPIEYPRTVYYVDRIKEKNIVRVTFELAAPFDLQGLRLPRRVVIGGACPFRYKGAATSLSKAARVGGCDWDAEFIADEGDALFLNEFDEYVLDITGFSNYTGSEGVGDLVKTTQSLEQYSTDGLTVTTVSDFNYWQALTASPPTPSDSDKTNWRRVRAYKTYSGGTTYYGYKNKKFNEYILNSGVLWRVKLFSVDTSVVTSVQEGRYWTAGDRCGKKINSCALRYYAQQIGTSGTPSTNLKSTEHLRFGGFPGVQQRR